MQTLPLVSVRGITLVFPTYPSGQSLTWCASLQRHLTGTTYYVNYFIELLIGRFIVEGKVHRLRHIHCINESFSYLSNVLLSKYIKLRMAYWNRCVRSNIPFQQPACVKVQNSFLWTFSQILSLYIQFPSFITPVNSISDSYGCHKELNLFPIFCAKQRKFVSKGTSSWKLCMGRANNF